MSEPIADNSVTPIKTTFFKTGKNLFNISTATIGCYVNNVTGTIDVSANYVASDYIVITPSTNYTETTSLYTAFYDVNKSYISGISAVGITTRTFITPSNAKYVRITAYLPSYNVGTNANNYQLEIGTSATVYEAFKQIIPKELLEDKVLDITTVPINSIEATQTKFIKIGKNIFNNSTITSNKSIASGTGTLSYHALLAVSDYIQVTPSLQYTCNKFNRSVCFYNSSKVYISGIDAPTNTIIVPSDCYYMIVNPYITDLDTFQVELGSTSTSYESFYYKLDKSQQVVEQFLSFLPSEICVAVGRTIELYNNQVSWCGNINNYHFKWDCTIGKAMKRKFTVTGTTALIGEYALSLTIYDNNMNVVAITSTTIKIVSATISTTENILTIGDSLSNNKVWLGELRTLSNNQFTMVGTRGTSLLKHEGRSGWSGATYLTGASYTYESEGVNPFWDGTRFNWNYYKTQTGLNPNAIQIFLGTNGMELDPTTNATNIKQIVDYVRQDDATIPIFLVYTLYRGNQDGIGDEISSDGYAGSNKGAWKLQEDRKVFNLMVKLNDLLSSYTNLHFVPISLCHDSEFNFGAVSTPVNPRATQTELLPSQATHPQDQGYFQFADIMFSVMAKYLNS